MRTELKTNRYTLNAKNDRSRLRIAIARGALRLRTALLQQILNPKHISGR